MKKSEIKNLKDNELITEYVKTYAHYDTNFISRRGTERLGMELRNLESELLKRNILTVEDIQRLNM